MNQQIKEFGLSMIPLTPVSFKGPNALYAYGRLAIYGVGAYYAFSKKQNLAASILAGAAGVSALSSATAQMWEKQTQPKITPKQDTPKVVIKPVITPQDKPIPANSAITGYDENGMPIYDWSKLTKDIS